MTESVKLLYIQNICNKICMISGALAILGAIVATMLGLFLCAEMDNADQKRMKSIFYIFLCITLCSILLYIFIPTF